MHTVCLDWLTEQVRCPVQNYCYLQCENCVVSTQYNKSLFGKAENWPRSFFGVFIDMQKEIYLNINSSLAWSDIQDKLQVFLFYPN